MLLVSDNRQTTVTLSETNLRSLLAAYEAGQDARMIRAMVEDGSGQLLTVVVESDEDHYCDRPRGESGVHPSLR